MKKKAWRRIFVVSSCAFILYGVWTFIVNYSHGSAIGLKSALAQGCMSFFVTAFMTTGIEYLHSKIHAAFLRFWLAGLVPIVLLLLLMAIIHKLIGTPHIIITIMPSAIIGLLYSLLYSRLLEKKRAV